MPNDDGWEWMAVENAVEGVADYIRRDPTSRDGLNRKYRIAEVALDGSRSPWVETIISQIPPDINVTPPVIDHYWRIIEQGDQTLLLPAERTATYEVRFTKAATDALLATVTLTIRLATNNSSVSVSVATEYADGAPNTPVTFTRTGDQYIFQYQEAKITVNTGVEEVELDITDPVNYRLSLTNVPSTVGGRRRVTTTINAVSDDPTNPSYPSSSTTFYVQDGEDA